MKHITKSCPSTSGYFIVNNLFNELSSEAQKQIARENLGISDQYSLYWGNIKGYIEDQIDFIQKLEELIREYGGELSSELERIVADVNTRLDNLLNEVNSILYESIRNFEVESDQKLNQLRTEFNESMEQWSTAVTSLIRQWEDLNLLKYPYTNPKDPTIQTVGDALTKLGLGVAKVPTVKDLYSFPSQIGDLVYVLENDVTYKCSKDGWQAFEQALVISDSKPTNTNVIWYEQNSDYHLNLEGNLNSVRKSIKTLEDQMSQVLRILNYGVIAGDASIGARTNLYSSAVPINPNTGEEEEEFIKPEGLPSTVPNLSIKCDVLENFSKNKRNLIDGELIWIIDKNSLYIYYANRFIPISNTSGGGNDGNEEIIPEDDMTQEDIEKLYFNYLGLVNKNQDQFRMEVNENGNIIVYNTQNYDGAIGSKGTYGSYISDYLRINSIFIGGETTSLDSFSACSHNFVELANASTSDINLYGIHLLYKKPGTAQWEDLPLKGMIKAGSTFLIRGDRCSYKSNITLDVEDYDMQWFNSSGKLMRFDGGGGCFYLVCTNQGQFNDGSSWVSLDNFGGVMPYNKDGSPEGYIDLVGIKSNETTYTIHAEGGAPIAINSNENIRECIFVRAFTLDPCSQAQKAHNKKGSNTLWTYINMSTQDEPKFPYYTEKQKHLYVPKSSRWGKNIYGTRSTFSENTPNMVNITFGIQATDNGNGATRCFNWVSVGYYDEYVEYKKNGETWEQAKTKKSINTDNYRTEYASDSNVAEFINIYKRIKWVTTNNTAVTTHKAIIRGLEEGTYNYRIRRTSDPNYMSEVFNFTVRFTSAVNEGFNFVHTTDQQAFNFYEYQAWTKAAQAISANHNNIHFTLNTGDCTQNGNRESEWLDYYAGREALRDIEEMYVIGNNDLCGIVPYELGDGTASKYKINHKNIQYYYTFEIDSNNPPIFKYVDSNLDINKMGDVLEGNSTMFKYYMPSVYSFNYGNYHFIGLNSEFADNTYQIYYNDTAKGGSIKEHAYYNMYKWLEKDLALNPGKNYVAFMHELPFCIIVGDSTTNVANARTQVNGSKLNHDFSNGILKTEGVDNKVYTGGCCFSELFQNNNVKLALGGHKHTYSLSYPTKENITYNGNLRSVDYANPIIDKVGNDGVVYAMSQATGYKLVSNKELPGTGINWLRKYFPMANGSASSSQYYPMYSLISTAGNTLELRSYAVYNIFKEKTAFNINNQYPEFLQKNSTLINLASDPDTLENITINY